MDVRVIITAAGAGTRFGQEVPKQFVRLGCESVLGHTIRCFRQCKFITEIAIVLPPDFISAKDFGFPKIKYVVKGKKTRAESVYEGLMKISLRGFSSETVVLVHDGVRPLITEQVIQKVAIEAGVHGAAIAATKVTDTIKEVDARGFICSTLSREHLWKAATPQGFRMDVLLKSYKKALNEGYLEFATDEAYLAEKAGYPVFIVEGNPENIKITTPTDLAIAEALLVSEANANKAGL